MRAAGRRRPADSQPGQRARRRRWASSRRARRRFASIPTAATRRREQRIAYLDEVLRRVKAGAGRRERGHHRRAAARPQPHLGRGREGRHLRARQVSPRLRARRQRGLSGGDGHSAAGRTRPRRERHAGQASRSSSSTRRMARRAVAGRRIPIGKYIARRRAPRSGASSASSATSATWRSSRRPATRCTSRCASAAITPSADLVVRSTLPPAPARRHASRGAGSRSPPTSPGNDFRTLQQLVDKSVSPRRFTGAAARRLRRVRAGAGVARHLRADLVLRQPAHAGDRHPHGARRLRARRAGAHHRADAAARRRSAWRSARSARGLLVARRRQPAVRRDAARSADVPRHGRWS